MLAAIGIAIALSELGPPFRKAWVLKTGESTAPLAKVNSTYVFEDNQVIRAIDLSSGKQLWTRAFPKGTQSCKCLSDGSGVYVAVIATYVDMPVNNPRNKNRNWKDAGIWQLDPATGRTLKKISFRLDGFSTVSDGVAYVPDDANHLAAIDLQTSKIRWQVKYSESKEQAPNDCPVVTPDTVVVGSEGDPRLPGSLVALNRETGAVRWRRKGESGPLTGLPASAGGVLIMQDERIRGYEPATLRQLWSITADEACRQTMGIGDRLILSFSRSITEIDPKNGTIYWHYDLRSPNDYDWLIGIVRAGDALMIGEAPNAAISLEGKQLWRTKEIEGLPLWGDDQHVVLENSGSIVSYEHGSRPAIPATVEGERAMAIEMCKHLETLDDAEKQDLVKLGEPAFEPLLERCIKVGEEFQRKREYLANPFGQELPSLLCKVITDRSVPRMIREVKRTKVNGWVAAILFPALLMADAGTETEDVNLCLWVLGKAKPTAWPGDESSMALSFLRACKDPRAKRYVRNWDRRHPTPKRRTPRINP